jgi:hypothetical protein
VYNHLCATIKYFCFFIVYIKQQYEMIGVVTKARNHRAKSVGYTRHSQLFVHVLCMHAIVMYLCSSYAHSINSKTQILLSALNTTTLARIPN